MRHMQDYHKHRSSKPELTYRELALQCPLLRTLDIKGGRYIRLIDSSEPPAQVEGGGAAPLTASSFATNPAVTPKASSLKSDNPYGLELTSPPPLVLEKLVFGCSGILETF